VRKVLLISSTFPISKPGGVPTFVEGRAALLSQHDDVRVAALGRSTRGSEISLGSIGKSKWRIFVAWARLIAIVVRLRPHYVEVHNAVVALPVFIFLRPVYFFHGPARLEAIAESSSKFRIVLAGLIEKFVVVRSNKILFASSTFRKLFVGIYPNKRSESLEVCYPKLVRFDQALVQTAVPSRYFVCVRRLVKRTGIDLAIGAFAEGCESGRIPADIRLVIAGEGPERVALEKLAQLTRVGDRIDFVGRVSNGERNHLYSNAIASLVPTRALEGFGLVVLEAGYFGCPSVVTDVGALPEVIQLLGGNGFVTNESEFADAMIKACSFNSDQRDVLQKCVIDRFFV